MTRRAFTLVEVVLALGLVGLVVGITFAALRDLGARERQIAEHAARVAQIATLDSLIDTALRGSVVALDDEAGITLSAGELHLVHRGVTPADASSLDRVDLTLRWDETTGEITATHAGAAAMTETVVEGVAWFDVRVHDGAAWRAGFDSSRAGALPAAVRVSIWFGEAPLADLHQESARVGAADPTDGSAPSDDPLGFEDAWPAGEAIGPSNAELIPPTRAPDRMRVHAIPDGGRASGEVWP